MIGHLLFGLAQLAAAGPQAQDTHGWPAEFALRCTYDHGVESLVSDGRWVQPRPARLEFLGRPTFDMGIRIGRGFSWSRGGDVGVERVEGHDDHVFITILDGAPVLRDEPTSSFTYRARPGDDGGPFQMLWNEASHVTVFFGYCQRRDHGVPAEE